MPPPLVDPRFQPRYAPSIALLRHDQGHLRRAPAAAYWSLTPFHIQQPDDITCGPTSVAVVLSALRARAGKAPPQVSTAALIDLAGSRPAGFTLAELAVFAEGAASAAEVGASISALWIDSAADAASALREDLDALEAGRHFLIVNFAVNPVLAAGDVGHFSPIGAFDATSDRALVLDVYRQAFEPFWSPVPLLLDAMAAVDPDSGRPRGYLRLAPA